jgi:hypothetical protein
MKEGVLKDAPGEGFKGIILCDFCGVYRKFRQAGGALLQFCRTRLIRVALFPAGLEEAELRRYGKRVLKQIQEMFEMIHLHGETGGEKWKRRMGEYQEMIMRRVTGTIPGQKEARLIAGRTGGWEEGVFQIYRGGDNKGNE